MLAWDLDLAYIINKKLFVPNQVFGFRWYKFIDGTHRKQAVQMDDRVKQVSGTLIIREAKVINKNIKYN